MSYDLFVIYFSLHASWHVEPPFTVCVCVFCMCIFVFAHDMRKSDTVQPRTKILLTHDWVNSTGQLQPIKRREKMFV